MDNLANWLHFPLADHSLKPGQQVSIHQEHKLSFTRNNLFGMPRTPRENITDVLPGSYEI